MGCGRADLMAIHAAELAEEQQAPLDPINRLVSVAAKTLEAGDDRRGRQGAGRHPHDERGKQGTAGSRRHGQSSQGDERHGPLGSPGGHEYTGAAAARSDRPLTSARHVPSSSATGSPVTISTIRQSSQRESGSSPFFPTNPTWPP